MLQHLHRIFRFMSEKEICPEFLMHGTLGRLANSGLGKFKLKTIYTGLLMLLLCSQTLTAQTPVSGSFTINSNLPTSATNFQSFTEAVFSLAYGINGPVVFNVVPNSGPYVEQINLNFVPGASATNTITFNCNGVTMSNESTNAMARAVFKLDGARHVIIDSLKVLPITTDSDLSYGWGFALIHDADSNVIRKSTVWLQKGSSLYSQNNIGIYVGSSDDYPNSNGISDCDDNIITQNTIIGGYWGIVLDNYGANWSLQFGTMNNNQVTYNKVSNFSNTGIYIIWNRNTLVEGNDISGGMSASAMGIFVNEKNINLKVTGNRIHNIYNLPIATSFDFTAIRIAYCPADPGSNNMFYNNLVYDLRNSASQDGIAIASSEYADIVHNTILLDTAGAASSSVTNGFLYEGTNSNINFKNNILSILRTGSGSRYGINANSSGTFFASDYNDVVTSAGNNFGRNGSTTHATLLAWQTATTRDAHSTSQDPLFENIVNGILKPTNAAIDNMGSFAGVSSDVNHDIRNNTNPDAGAYEFLTPPCSTPVIGGTALGIPAVNICGGSLRTINLGGNSFGTGQTYQWQSSATLNGTYANVGGPLVVPAFDVNPSTSTYYRAVVGCGAGSATSTPVLITVNQPLSGTYTINSATATAGSNFQSFADLMLALKCGIAGPVVLNVVAGSGPYNEQLIINEIAGASAVNTITINGNGETLSFLSATTNERATLKLNGADHVTINNLTLTALGSASGQYGYGIQLMNDADYNVINNCRVNINTTSTSANFAGIVVSSSATDAIGSSASKCDHNKINGNTITGGYYGITLYSDASVEKIINDTISNNILKDMYAYGIFVSGTDHALVEGNDISRPTRLNSGTLNAIYLTNISTSLVVSKNRIHNSFGGNPAGTNASNAIYSNNCDATSTDANIISNNLVYDFGGTGAQVGLYNSSSDFNLYYHNTISLENKTGTPTTTARAIYQTGTASGLEYKNNIVTVKRSGTGTNHAFYLNTAATSYLANNNNYFVAGTGTNKIGFKSSTSYTTLDEWKTGSLQEAASLSVDPLYTDLLNGNLSPREMQLDNKGTNVGITTDIIGLARSATTPDIGAYEFAGVLPVKLLKFTATRSGSDVIVNWATATEINSSKFIVERSADGIAFSEAGTLAAAGNSSAYLQYRFIDRSAVNFATSQVIYYRLKSVDKDAKYEYSNVVAVHLDNKDQVVFSVLPNPFVAELYVSITTSRKATAVIQLSDITGRIIQQKEQALVAGNTLVGLDGLANIQKDVYLVRVVLNDQVFIQRVVK